MRYPIMLSSLVTMLSLMGCSPINGLLATRNNTEIIKTQDNGTAVILLEETKFFIHMEDAETNTVIQKEVIVEKNTAIKVGMKWKPTLDYVLKEVKGIKCMTPDSNNVLHESTITIPIDTVIQIGNHWNPPVEQELPRSNK